MAQSTINAAFELARQHGFTEALRMAEAWRDSNAAGSVTFALHNELCKQLREFAAAGAMFRTF